MDLTDAPTSNAEEKSTPLNHIQISEITLPADGAPILERKMRLRRLDVFPGGVIGLHDHSNRPAILFVLKGSMTIHDDKSDAPIVVNEGESVSEVGAKHYAVNNSARDP
jgi:quercetin dioxygenase-like cupin family protein